MARLEPHVDITSDHAIAPSADGPSSHEVRSALEHLLASPGFDATAKRRAFLRFIVEETLAGRGSALKGFTVANAVFGRDETFDSKIDPVVRLEARRLRRDLDSYYIGPGTDDPIRISLPKGGYVPEFELRGPDVAAKVSSAAPNDSLEGLRIAWRALVFRRGAWPTLLAGAAVVVIAALGLMQRNNNIMHGALDNRMAAKIVILPFVANDTSEVSRSISAGLGSELLVDLSKFPGLRLYQPVGGLYEPDRTDDPTYIVMGHILAGGPMASIVAQLQDARSGEVVWSEAYRLPVSTQSLVETREDIALQIATTLGQPYGPLAESLRSRSSSMEGSSVESYLCVQSAFGYRRGFSAEEYGPVLKCLEDAVRRDPGYPDAWAMLGWLYMDDGRFGFTGGDQATLYARGAEAAERALDIDANNLNGLKAMASIRHYTGDYAESQTLARRAVQLNPHDPDTLAQLGWRLAVRGNFKEGAPLLNAAIERSVHPPGWYYHLLIIQACLDGDFARMESLAELSVKDGSELSYSFLMVARVALEDYERAAWAALKVPAGSPLRRDPEAFFRRHGATDEITSLMGTYIGEAFASVESSALR